jgi:MOSC domain-containing protein YiiM
MFLIFLLLTPGAHAERKCEDRLPAAVRMPAKILSLNVGRPKAYREYRGDPLPLETAIDKHPIEGPMIVQNYRIIGDKPAGEMHGGVFRVLYALGKKQIEPFMKEFGHDEYEPGFLGENVLLDDLDESKIRMGDVFKFGEVIAEVWEARTACDTLNFRMQNNKAVKKMMARGCTGVMFTILKPGKIHYGDKVERIKLADENAEMNHYIIPYLRREGLRGFR